MHSNEESVLWLAQCTTGCKKVTFVGALEGVGVTGALLGFKVGAFVGLEVGFLGY